MFEERGERRDVFEEQGERRDVLVGPLQTGQETRGDGDRMP